MKDENSSFRKFLSLGRRMLTIGKYVDVEFWMIN